MLSSVGEFTGALKALPADEESKISREFSGVSLSSAVDSMISTMRNEEGYPNGLKVLVVDEDLSLLKEIEPMLALSMLHDKTRKFDIILMAILGNDMEGFKKIQQLAMEADLPIKYLLPEATPWSIVKTLGSKASKLTKPVRLSRVRTLWSTVARKRKEKLQKKLITGILKEDENYMDGKDDAHYTSFIMNRKPVIPWRASKLQGQFIWEVIALGGPKDYVEEHPVSDMPFVEPEQMCDDDFWRMV
ncbi:hypothetical protein MKX03_032552 [Papaver bracteatum]|nr:hypothetical protein MKX03_032552 [Papaver bracteatum]